MGKGGKGRGKGRKGEGGREKGREGGVGRGKGRGEKKRGPPTFEYLPRPMVMRACRDVGLWHCGAANLL